MMLGGCGRYMVPSVVTSHARLLVVCIADRILA